jgi:hypothetical protein
MLIEEGESSDGIILQLMHSLTLDAQLVSDGLERPTFDRRKELHVLLLAGQGGDIALTVALAPLTDARPTRLHALTYGTGIFACI